MKIKNLTSISNFFAAVGIIGLFFLGYMHEVVHVEIFKTYNISARMDFIHYFPDFATIPEKRCPTDNCNLANDINEVIGYPLLAFYLLFFVAFYLIILMLEFYLMGKYE